MTADPVALVERAAGLAEQAAAVMGAHWTAEEDWTYLLASDARLIAASGPDHWRAVAELLRAILASHTGHPMGERWCMPAGCTDPHPGRRACDEDVCVWPCRSILALLPLSLLIVNQLGDDGA